jgi:oxygen-dependent protoporphyrinogen oxidase
MTASAAERSGHSVVVIGGGIAGLAAAWELSGGERPDPAAPRIVVLESSRRLGGPLRSAPFAERIVDLGPDGFLGRRPEAEGLCRELGLGDQLAPIGASGARVYTRGRLRALPDALMLGVPTRWWPAARSGVLGPMASLRLLRDVVAPRPDRRGPLGDRALGPLVERRLGRGVVDTLVDPLVGGIHAGSVADMSTAAVLPQLLAVASRHGGLMRALRRATPAPAPADGGQPGPLFWALTGGMGSLVERLEAELRSRAVDIRTARSAERLTQASGDGPAWSVETAAGPIPADGLVLAVPAGVAAQLLAPHDADAATLERSIEYATVSVITLSYRADGVSLPDGTGFLVPRATPSPLAASGGGDLLVTAGTFLTAKWPHLARPGSVLLRASVGRFTDRRADSMDDNELAHRVAAELSAILAMTGSPTETMVSRWTGAFPQYRVGHLLRVSGIEAAVKRLPRLAVAGSAYRGVGIPACIGWGGVAAQSVLSALRGRPGTPTTGSGPPA